MRFAALLLNLYGALALTLAAIGVYGVLSAGVASRLREVGIRAALGAEPRQLQRAVVGQGLAVTATAVVAGSAITAAVGSNIQTMFFETRATDLRVLGATAALLLLVALAASLVPARLRAFENAGWARYSRSAVPPWRPTISLPTRLTRHVSWLWMTTQTRRK